MNSIRKPALNPDLIRLRAHCALAYFSPCRLCPHACGALRADGEIGRCGIGESVSVGAVMPHHGEERCLSGFNGSGTIFFAGCNLDCVFCQNYDLSQLVNGKILSLRELASAMTFLQELECHNVNWVTPTHVIPQILQSLAYAVEDGFTLPIVYNSGGYDSVEILKLLDGIVDIYMPDFKYWDSETAERFSGARDYPEAARNALREMYRQVGDLQIDDNGLATRGLLVRHLVLPGDLAGTASVMRFLAEEISPNTFINVMGQYHPCYRAKDIAPLDRPLFSEELLQVRQQARKAGLSRFSD